MEEAVDLMLDPRHGHHSSISSIHLNNTARREVIRSISSTEVNTPLSNTEDTHLNSNTEGTVVVIINYVLKDLMVDINNKVMEDIVVVRTTTKETRRRRRRRRTLPRPRIFPRLPSRRKRRRRRVRRRRKREVEWKKSPGRRKE